MSFQSIPSGTDLLWLSLRCFTVIGRGFSYDGQSFIYPSGVSFNPDLSSGEMALFSGIVEQASSRVSFGTLPDWSTFTIQAASDFINQSIFNGQSLAQVTNTINANIPNITTANVTQINNSLAGIRTTFGLAASAIISIRTILQAMAKVLVFVRNILLR